MECPKCRGFMQLERMADFFLVFYAWKCINCGALVDKTIAKNRRASMAPQSPDLTKADKCSLASSRVPGREIPSVASK
jgi:hypothetical protein